MKPKKTSNLGKFVRFTGLGFQMGVTIWAGNWFGNWLDVNHPAEGVSYTKIITMIAVFGSIVSTIIQVIRLGKKDENNG